MLARPLGLVLGLVFGITPVGWSQASPGGHPNAPAPDSVTVVPGARYEAGWLHRVLLGDHYRDLWTTPVEAEVLDLGSFAGGLRPTKRGGGQQTRSLRFRGADGREYAFRSIDKDPSSLLPAELRGTVVSSVVQDQISAGHPAAPFVVAPLLKAAGVLYAEPRLVILPDGDSRLGEFEPEFGGMLGVFEERPDASDEDEAGFAGASEIISSDKLLKRLEDSPDDRVDARAFLKARLVDLFLGDWDRHRNQWRWARFGKAKPVQWVP
ncbi:MAG: BamA/TamA family outer membrane protein, partial [Gemmatimonadales bacterium]